MRAQLILFSLAVALSAQAQRPPATTASLPETVSWLTNFSQSHGLLVVGSAALQSNYFVAVNGCTLRIERRYLQAKDPSAMKTVRTSLSLSVIDPNSILVHADNNNEVAFETTDSSAKFALVAETVNGEKREFWSARDGLFFDSDESARRVASALKHAVNLCGGKAAPF